MSNIINLRHVRKAKSRRDNAAKADKNRAKYGRSKAERQIAKQAAAQQSQDMAGKKLCRDEPE